MRAVSRATCTSGEPVSPWERWNCDTISDLLMSVTAISITSGELATRLRCLDVRWKAEIIHAYAADGVAGSFWHGAASWTKMAVSHHSHDFAEVSPCQRTPALLVAG